MLTDMTAYYVVEPEVAGGLGPRTVIDRSQHPPRVAALEYVFEGWLGDALLESFPCFIATDALAAALAEVGASGYIGRPVRVSESDLFREMQPFTALPVFVWLDLVGQAGVDDCGADRKGRLVVSARVLSVLREAGITRADVSEWRGEPAS